MEKNLECVHCGNPAKHLMVFGDPYVVGTIEKPLSEYDIWKKMEDDGEGIQVFPTCGCHMHLSLPKLPSVYKK